MKSRTIRRWLPILLLPLAGASAPTPSAVATATPSAHVRGEYVEARTASVWAGACHYNGERVTEGRSAVMAWRIDGGSFNGIDLAGVRVAASVACDDNLAERTAARRSSIVVDAATDAQSAAAVAWVEARLADQLGSVVSVRRQPITFTQADETFAVKVDGFAAMSVQAMPDRACCTQPQLVWYQPLMPVTGRRVGYTALAESDVTEIGTTWQRADENSAIYGQIAD